MIYSVQVEFQKDFLIVKGNLIKIGIKAKPIKGKANVEVIKKLARHFGVSSSRIIIKSGLRSKQKIVEILS